MKKFEDLQYKGIFSEYLNNCKPHRVESIYNKQYRYIKEIIWDDERNEKYGNTRAGYDRFNQEDSLNGLMSYSGEIDLRVLNDRETKEPLLYMTETKCSSNESYMIIFEQYQHALNKLQELLEVTDTESLNYWLNECRPSFTNYSRGANETISAIQSLEEIYNDYNEDEEFRSFIDKIKV
jgi:hypothetical protein